MKQEFGYYVGEEVLVCSNCADNEQYIGLLSLADSEGYPNGYTCADCGTTIKEETNG